MDENSFLNGLVIAWFALALINFPVLMFVTAPYGRHTRRGWGPAIPSKLGWVIMEAPAAFVFGACFVFGAGARTVVTGLFFLLWEIHYAHRAFIYPLSRRGGVGRMPFAIVGTGFLFNTLNGYMNGRYIFAFSGGYPATWLLDVRFLTGLGLFLAGFVINRQADHMLRNLRRPGETVYRLPRGGLYRWISCPNYFGEIVEWIGWAVMTWSLAGLAFAVWTTANLVPRALAHHRWYREHFPNYPPERKALVPGLW